VTDTYDKINYWYGYNGNEIPVHPDTMVAAVTEHAGTFGLVRAGDVRWTRAGEPDDIIAFCITRLYVEPRKAREWWVLDFNTGAQSFVAVAGLNAVEEADPFGNATLVHVREVLPEPTQ
jgi:hypothetical protein